MKKPPSGGTASSSTDTSENGYTAYSDSASSRPALSPNPVLLGDVVQQQVRELWWRMRRQGVKLPAEKKIILFDSDCST